MTDSPGPAPGAGLAARTPWRAAVWAAARAAASAAALLAIYYLLPLDRVTGGLAVTILVAGLVLLIGLVAFQVRSILGSRLPGLRAVEALATSVPLFLLLFAATYVVLATMSPGNFSQPLTRSDALYFTVTVFATVGFGDITAITQTARLIVTGQMIADFVVIGVAVRVIVSAAQRGRAATRERLATSREYHVQERYRYSMSLSRWAYCAVAVLVTSAMFALDAPSVLGVPIVPRPPSVSSGAGSNTQIKLTSLGPGHEVSGLIADSDNPYNSATQPYPAANPTTGFTPKNESFAGVIFATPTGGGTPLSMYCIDILTSTYLGFGYELGTWDNANVPNVGFVARVLQDYYPNTNQPASLASRDDKAAHLPSTAMW